MTRRLDQIPVFETRPAELPAARYNRARLALGRLGSPLRLPLPGLRPLALELDDSTWICLDASLGDLPVIAWSDFAPRRALHSPVPCRLRLYHQHAALILERVGGTLDAQLAERLTAAGPP